MMASLHGVRRFTNPLFIRLTALAFFVAAASIPTRAQMQAPAPQSGKILGTATDSNGGTIAGATVVLARPNSTERRTVVTPDNGFFEFDDIKPGIAYTLTVSAGGFADWTSPEITIEPGEFHMLESSLRVAVETASVQVTYDPVEVATEQFKLEEKQRVFGFLPNFYVSYNSDAAPLTPKMKFKLALKVSVDPITIAGVAFIAGLKQAGNTPKFGQGMSGYGKRVGAVTGDGFTDIMIGGAILPSLLHQDPRYFYKGTGPTRSRLRHALLSPFVAKGDNGAWQPNYSSVGGVLASSAIANLYYPKQDRGAGLVFSSFAIGTAERIGASLAQEFILARFTHRGGHVK